MKMISIKCFSLNAFHKMQEKRDGEKSRKPWLIIISVGRIALQELIDISADDLANNTGV